MPDLAASVLPKGVYNLDFRIVSVVGAALSAIREDDKVPFPWPSAVEIGIMAPTATRSAHTTPELGGKSPCIIFPDSDDDATAQEVVAAMRFALQGQSCTAGSRLYVHESIWESFLPKVEAAIRKLEIGDSLNESSDMGAVINLSLIHI